MARHSDPRLDPGVAALVLKTGDYRLHHGGLGAIRSLGRAGVPVYGVHEDPFTPAALSAYLHGGFVWRTGDQYDYQHQLLDGIGRVAERIGGPCVVVPTDDHTAVFLNERADRLPEKLLVPDCRPGLALDLVNKRRCAQIAEQADFPMPRTRVQRCPAPEGDLADVELPVVVKRAVRALLPDGSRTYSTLIARTRAELRAATTEPGPEYEVLLQELVPGRPGDDWLFHAYCDTDSVSLVSFTGRKLRSYPAYAGETACARSEDNPELRERAERFLKAVGFSGVVSMDVRYDRRDRSYRVLDVNPRAGAGFRMFENIHGVDVVRALHLDLSGRPVPRGPQLDGRTYVVENYDLRTRRTYAKEQGLTRRAVLRGLRTADERAWLTADDLVPAAALALRGLLPPRWLERGPTTLHYFSGRASRPSWYPWPWRQHGDPPARRLPRTVPRTAARRSGPGDSRRRG
ncbi:ATP-grasp domain-containing protein [Streptomyces sp. NPDC052012]|uniref:carboxylate--amine ligase n=1 Tax=Streptomyces sp. NPDC052012 TaxID=3155051 RepID=UPI00344D5C31